MPVQCIIYLFRILKQIYNLVFKNKFNMKRNSFKWCVYTFLFLGIGMVSCADEDLMTYEDVPRIYFKYADASSSDFGENEDQITVNMGYDRPLKNDSIIKIPIKLMGRVSETDRAVKVVMIPEESTATEGEDIEILSAYLPANSIFGNVEVRLKRTEAVDNEMLFARIRLASNENFHTDYSTSRYDKGNNRNGLIYSIYFTALAEKPSLWAASYSSMTLESTFGAYSNAKMNVIYEACGVTREYFEIDPEDNDPTGKETFTKRFSREVSFGMISLINRYLVKYKEEQKIQKQQSIIDSSPFSSSALYSKKLKILSRCSLSSSCPCISHFFTRSMASPDSPQAVQAQLVMAKLAYDKADYAGAEKALKKVENAKDGDAGLLQIVKLRLAYAQLAQKKYDEALKTLAAVNDPAFKATADEARGDIYVAKNDIENAKKVYQSAWDALLERKEERQILQIKLESVGVLVDDPEIERPILETQMEAAE